jgi:hypothetical protein
LYDFNVTVGIGYFQNTLLERKTMTTSVKLTKKSYRWATLPTLLIAVLLIAAGSALAGKSKILTIVPPDATFHGKTYGELNAQWFEWYMELPVQDKHGNPLPHPGIDDPNFDVRDGQTGDVWFLAAPFGTVERTATIPQGKALFIALLNAEASSLEEFPFYGANETDQRYWANWNADHIVEGSLFFEIDGVPIPDITSYRAESPQFKFKAPTPWIFGATGGKGTSVGDGYYVLLEPLPKGEYTIHYGGALHYSVADGDGFDYDASLDMTYHLTVK